MHPADSDILAPAEVADRLGLTEDTVRSLLTDGQLPGRNLAGCWRVHWPAVLATFAHDPAADVLRTPDLATRLRLAETTVLRLLADGTLPGRRLGRQWFTYWPAVLSRLGCSRAGDDENEDTRA